jgi:hypothetical protein
MRRRARSSRRIARFALRHAHARRRTNGVNCLGAAACKMHGLGATLAGSPASERHARRPSFKMMRQLMLL